MGRKSIICSPIRLCHDRDCHVRLCRTDLRDAVLCVAELCCTSPRANVNHAVIPFWKAAFIILGKLPIGLHPKLIWSGLLCLSFQTKPFLSCMASSEKPAFTPSVLSRRKQTLFCIATFCRWLHACECSLLLTEHASLHVAQLQHSPLPWPRQPQDRSVASRLQGIRLPGYARSAECGLGIAMCIKFVFAACHVGWSRSCYFSCSA